MAFEAFSDIVPLLVIKPPLTFNDVPLSRLKLSPALILSVPIDALVSRLTAELIELPPSIKTLLAAAFGKPETLQLEFDQLPLPPSQV